MTRLVHRRSHRFLVARENRGVFHLATAKANQPREIAFILGSRRRINPLRPAAFLTIAPIRDLMHEKIIQGRI